MLLMAIINPRSGRVSGGTKAWQPQVATIWKGKQVLRNYSRNITPLPTLSRKAIQTAMNQFATRWEQTLSTSLKNLWDQYAGNLGSAVTADMSGNVSNAKQVIPEHARIHGIESGINSYISANILAFEVNIPTPLDIPPIGEQTPTPPLQVAITNYDPLSGNVTVTWVDPILAGAPVAKVVRIWTYLQAKKKWHSQVVGFLPLPSPQTFQFNTIRSGHAFNSPSINLNQVGQGVVRVQMDSIVGRKPGQGVVLSQGSNTTEFKIVNP